MKASLPFDTDAFVRAARDMQDALPDYRAKAVLELLLRDATGHARAIPLSRIVQVLKDDGINVDIRWIQHHVIKPSRAGRAFLGTCRAGVFVITNKDDLDMMLEWYRERIQSEQVNLGKLTRLGRRCGIL